jgi:Bacterial Alpha-2-macroglobulin MG10 domain/Alpha-2-macroglobulin family/MG2 domain
MMKITATVILFTFSFFVLQAQTPRTDYEKRWKKIDSLIDKKGLTASALQEVNGVYAIAKKEKNDPQLIKALLYKMRLQDDHLENGAKINVNALEKEIKTASEPAKSILQNILAETFWEYVQQSRWKLYDRTKIGNEKSDDFETWSIDAFHKKITVLYLASIKEENLLKQTRVETFEAIIEKGNSRYLRPTLFDLLAHRALEYFRNNETDITKAAYEFELNDAQVFAAERDFANYHFKSPDSSSVHFVALQLFQRLLLFHQTDPKPDALLDVDIERIQFVHSYAVMENSQALYFSALEKITGKYGDLPAAAQAWYLEAEQYETLAQQYDPVGDTSNRYAYVKAKGICDHVLTENDSSEGKSNCANLLKIILRKQLTLQTEMVNLPGEPFRAFVEYKNISSVNFRIIKLDHGQRSNFENQWQEDYWKRLTRFTAEKSFTQAFPETGDYQSHRAEMKIDLLPVGEYALLASADPNFSMEKNVMSIQFFYVSDIAWISNGLDYFVLNRENGQPIPRASVQFWYPYYNSQQKRNLERMGENIITDKNGFFRVNPPKTSKNSSFKIEVTSIGDHLFLDDEIQSYFVMSEEDQAIKADLKKQVRKTFFFTDRSVYRPGQTVYFKGIVITSDLISNQSKITSGFKTKVILYDVNHMPIDSVAVSSNDFGSFSGKFSLPENLLNGEFMIIDESTGEAQDFSVEEYKRPKFFVDYEKIKGSYQFNDTVKITGYAKGFAGNNIDRAQVTFSVTRLAMFPYAWLFNNENRGGSAPVEIVHGQIQTSSDGKFIISFPAIPGHERKALGPVFNYTVNADVTDISGETRSGRTTIAIGYNAINLYLSASNPEHMPIDSVKNILVKTENLADEFEPATVHIAIYKLKAPTRLIRQRYWKQPDEYVMSREEYLKDFPHDEYSDETNKANWEKTEKVLDRTGSTKESGAFDFGAGAGSASVFSTGWYQLNAETKDKNGESVKNLLYLEMYDPKNETPESPSYDWTLKTDQRADPGSHVLIDIGTSASDVFVVAKVNRNSDRNISPEKDTAFHFQFLSIRSGKKGFVLPVAASDRGGISVNYSFVKDNRVFFGTNEVDVPWENKDLSISYESFRDRTLPGSKEQWKIKIAGNQKEKAVAEVLTGMYDASLDQFRPHGWVAPFIYLNSSFENSWDGQTNFSLVESQNKDMNGLVYSNFLKTYDKLVDHFAERLLRLRGGVAYSVANVSMASIRVDGKSYQPKENANAKYVPPGVSQDNSQVVTDSTVMTVDNGVGTLANSRNDHNSAGIVQVRKNFNETAFFFPDLRTDSSGSVEFSFNMPEAVTQWKWMNFAHTKDLAFGYSEKSVITQKELMVQPNLPRFLREGDKIELSVKIVNLTDSEMTGQAELQLLDATTNEPVDGLFINREANQYFTAAAKQSVAVNFAIDVPFQFNKPVICRIVARSKNISDGEEAALPILSDRLLVTESLLLNMPGSGTKNYKFDKLLRSGNSETLNQHRITLEYTANPVWYAVQALPYLMEYPYECSEQTFNRFYANALGSSIVKSSPRIQHVFENWKTSDTAAMLSNLQKNQELKSLLLEETPWVLQAKEESQQKRNIALLFDPVKMNQGLQSAINKLQDLQLPDGSFTWFKGGSDDRYITQYILGGIGHLKVLNALPAITAEKIKVLLPAALTYLDQEIKKDYDRQLKAKSDPAENHLDYLQIQYLYVRSFFPDQPIPGEFFSAINYYRKQSQQNWLRQNKYMQAMIALSLFRTGDIRTAKEILASLKQSAIVSEEMGMYWKENTVGIYWYQAPIETESLMIEAFHEIDKDAKSVGLMKTWLLRQKQTESWETTKETADACYALLLEGTDLLTQNNSVQVHLGSTVISSNDTGTTAGTGYFSKSIEGSFVKPEMGNISVSVSAPAGKGSQAGSTASWGAVYWQYFEDMDKISSSVAPLQIARKLFIEKNTDHGTVLQPVEENATLKIGDKVIVRIELHVDRNMEYVQMKDMRASCMEPVNVLSQYKWQGGLGYYESTKDAATNFFFSWLPKGTWVFEYPLFVMAAGNFSNGITTIQCMYAPEFTSHSEGVRVNAE